MDVLRQAFSLVAEYLKTTETAPVKNLMDTGIQLGRRFRALKLWMVLRYFGAAGIRQRLEAHVDLARMFAGWVDDTPGWERLAPVPFSVVCFRHRPAGTDDEAALERHNAAIMDAVNASGEAFLSHTKLDGRFVLRLGDRQHSNPGASCPSRVGVADRRGRSLIRLEGDVMNRLMASFLTAAALLAAPAVATADGFISPFIGANFGGNTSEKTTVWGGAIGFVGSKAGFEFDFGYTSEFFADEAFGVDGKLVTVMGNVMLGGGKSSGFSPYIAFGGGLIRTNISVIGDVLDVEAAKNSLGGDVGVGFFAGGKSLTLRSRRALLPRVRLRQRPRFRPGPGDHRRHAGLLARSVGIGLMW